MQMSMLEWWTPPTFDKYDGSSKPNEHMRMFINLMAFYTVSDLMWCITFSLSLKRESLAWFNSLSPNSIINFSIIHVQFSR